MATLEQINNAVRGAAETNFPSTRISRIASKPAMTWTGEDAVEVFIVFADRAATRISGGELMRNLSEVHDRLQSIGEERHPILRYATEDEFDPDGTP
jgi:hypothetical protein